MSGWAPSAATSAGELVAAGDQDQAAGCAGQQRAGPARRRGRCRAPPAPAGRPAGCGTARPARPGRPGSARRARRRRSRNPRSASAGVTATAPASKPRRLTYSWPSGKRCGDPVRPVHGQGGLADPGGARDRRDGDGGQLRLVGDQFDLVEERVELLNVHLAVDEPLGRGGQLPGRRQWRLRDRTQVHVALNEPGLDHRPAAAGKVVVHPAPVVTHDTVYSGVDGPAGRRLH